MNQNFEVQELLIAIAVRQQNPSILTADFLKYTGIVPSDWELARPPVITNTAAQVVYQNGVSIIAEVNRVIFAEAIAAKAASEVQIPAIARQYIQTVKQVSYQGVGINLRGLAPYEQKSLGARKYTVSKLLQPGAWQDFGSAPVEASMRLVYTLDEAQLYLEINEAQLQYPDQTTKPAVLFSANFNHAITQAESTASLTAIGAVIDQWQSDVEIFKELVNNKFLDAQSYSIHEATSEAEQLIIGAI
ncbi:MULTISPECIES: hypothetical protein [Calothrix]|uniref:Uncharacterized protein n=2 Tax=Calothrix TaxID=1186 RepID=A0ABR8AK13_9CYAN|nr:MULTISPECIES: hypothetical protein [Calothrix]MBD2200391.1 hypothetical protein [Calothrix parietina FACHB-288]MBD2229370.1 hypothetical protein [Calothrix anomala FACHB-343]